MKKNILIVCDDNTLLSKIAEAYLKKYAGFWVDIDSAGVATDGKKISELLMPILKESELEASVDPIIRNVKDIKQDQVHYALTLTKSAHEYCKKQNDSIADEIMFLEISNTASDPGALTEEIKVKMLAFAKEVPIKRWLKL